MRTEKIFKNNFNASALSPKAGKAGKIRANG
jgi:hypothetical protein